MCEDEWIYVPEWTPLMGPRQGVTDEYERAAVVSVGEGGGCVSGVNWGARQGAVREGRGCQGTRAVSEGERG